MKQTVDTGTETDTELIDSGCSSIQHSRCPSVATDEDIADLNDTDEVEITKDETETNKTVEDEKVCHKTIFVA